MLSIIPMLCNLICESERETIHCMYRSRRWAMESHDMGGDRMRFYICMFPPFFYPRVFICTLTQICLCVCVCVCMHVCVCRRRMEKRRTRWRARCLWNWSLWTIPILKTRSTTPPVLSRFLQTYTKAVSIQEYFISSLLVFWWKSN